MMRGDDKGARMANAMAVVAGRAARPCDVCARKRSRWYCAADEAYLCEGCDSSVHAANALALRHERVRLTPNGAPMKMDRRINTSEHPSSVSKKKLKSRPSAPVGRSGVTAAFHDKYLSDHTHSNANNGLREVKVESNPGNVTTEIDPSDDHFTAEELTGNANLLDDTPSMCPPHYDNSASNPDCHNVISEADFDHFLVSDPNDPNSTANWGDNDRLQGTPSSAGGGDVVDQDEDEDDDGGDVVGDDWMQLDPDFSNRGTLSDDDEYRMVPVAVPASAAGGGAFGRSLAHYSHDEKPTDGSCGLPTSSTRVGKPFKNIAGHSEWVKLEEGYSHEQALSNTTTSTTTTTSTCKIELSLNECDLRQVPTLRLNYDDVLSSWPGRDFRWADDGSSLVPGDDSNSDAMGGCYDLGLVPDLSSGGCGVDIHGHAAAMYGGCGPGGGVGGNAGGDDGMGNAGNAREVRVNRYREKRRTRLFSKKIRYEVRKLNAERRPRMKGRFVKRSPGRDA